MNLICGRASAALRKRSGVFDLKHTLHAHGQVDAAHHLHSSLREKIVEHVFVGESLRTLWRLGVFDVEVLRSEFDAYGYDIVMSRGPIVRHIQFKTGVRDKPGRVSIGVEIPVAEVYDGVDFLPSAEYT